MLKRIWNFLFYACKHKWEIIHKVNIYGDYSDLPKAFEYHLQCEKCGNVKNKRV